MRVKSAALQSRARQELEDLGWIVEQIDLRRAIVKRVIVEEGDRRYYEHRAITYELDPDGKGIVIDGEPQPFDMSHPEVLRWAMYRYADGYIFQVNEGTAEHYDLACETLPPELGVMLLEREANVRRILFEMSVNVAVAKRKIQYDEKVAAQSRAFAGGVPGPGTEVAPIPAWSQQPFTDPGNKG